MQTLEDVQASRARVKEGLGLKVVVRNGFSEAVIDVPFVVKDGVVKPMPRAKLANEIEKGARELIRKALADNKAVEARIKARDAVIDSVLDRKSNVTFFQFAELVERHWYGEKLPGFELIPRKSWHGRGYSHSTRAKRKFLYRLDCKNNPANEEFFEQRGRSRFWDPQDKDNVKPGPLGTKKLSQLTPEDCLVKTYEANGVVTHKVPEDTTLHSYVREVLGVAVKLGILESNPASLRVKKAK
jgi:hypothetical protein